MPYLLPLPREILHRVFGYADYNSHKELRRTSVLFGEIGRRWVFQTMIIKPKKDDLGGISEYTG
jgi:hypothetical protein